MTNEKLTNEEKINLDKINSFYDNNISVHIKLLRKNSQGKNIFLNGKITNKDSETVFVMKERVLGEIRISLFEIRPNGIFKEEKK